MLNEYIGKTGVKVRAKTPIHDLMFFEDEKTVSVTGYHVQFKTMIFQSMVGKYTRNVRKELEAYCVVRGIDNVGFERRDGSVKLIKIKGK